VDILPSTGLDAPQDSPALREEKRKDYRNVVLLQICMMCVALFAGDCLKLVGVTDPDPWTWLVYQTLAGGYLYLLWDMLRNFTRRPLVIFGILCLEIAIFLGAVVLNNFFHDIAHIDQINASLHFGLFAVEVLTIYVALRDMFEGPLQTIDKLWASGAIYFLAGFAFANLFNIVQLLDHQAYGTVGPVDHTSYFEGLYLSFTSLSGADNMYVNRGHLVRNLCMLECTFGQLYLVLLISRVLLPNDEVKTQAP
jgi:hypothetical protein